MSDRPNVRCLAGIQLFRLYFCPTYEIAKKQRKTTFFFEMLPTFAAGVAVNTMSGCTVTVYNRYYRSGSGIVTSESVIVLAEPTG